MTAAVRRLRGAMLPLACALFVAASATALVIPPDGSVAGSGVTVDAQGVVLSVAPGTQAWNDGIQPGWTVLAHSQGMTTYGSNGNERLIPDDQGASALTLRL